jgi:hypothetical protein
LTGGGGADTPPNFGDLLAACGMDETITAATDVEYGPISTAFDSASIYFEHDGDQHKLLGARGTFSLSFEANELPRISFTMTARYAAPTTATTATPSYAGLGNVVPITNTNTPTLTLFGETESLVSLNIDWGAVVESENIPNLDEVFLNDRAVIGSVTILQRQISDYDWYAKTRSDVARTLGVLAVVHGTVAGSIVDLDAPSVQVSNPQKGERKGNATLTMDLSLLPVSGNDEFTITTK